MQTFDEKNESGADLDDLDKLIVQSLAKLDGLALGVSIGVVAGLGLFLATNLLLFKGGAVVGPTLGLLSQYFPGYEVTFRGSFIGLIYGFLSGFVVGWLIAVLRNAMVRVYLHLLKLKGSFSAVNDYIDNP